MKTDPHLRELREEDLGALHEHQSDPVARNMAAFVPKDPSDFAQFSERWKKILSDDTVVKMAIEREGLVVGMIASFVRDGDREVTYWVGRPYWNKGIATSALRQFMRLVSSRPLFARAVQDNRASLRVLEKCGFTQVGEERSFAKARGEEVDEVIYRLA